MLEGWVERSALLGLILSPVTDLWLWSGQMESLLKESHTESQSTCWNGVTHTTGDLGWYQSASNCEIWCLQLWHSAVGVNHWGETLQTWYYTPLHVITDHDIIHHVLLSCMHCRVVWKCTTVHCLCTIVQCLSVCLSVCKSYIAINLKIFQLQLPQP